MIRKLILCPWFGPLPDWFDEWEANAARLKADGYDFLIRTNLPAFKQRVRDVLDIDCPIVAGEGKIHDFRCAFGLLFARELEGYDFWGHTDFDMVYGRVGTFLPDHVLEPLDLFSNHATYVSGPFSLYRNTYAMNRLFMEHEDWQGYLTNPDTTGWVETAYTDIVDEFHMEGEITRRYESWQTRDLDNFDRCKWDGDKLLEGEREIMALHFRRTKVYPPQLIR